MGILIGVCGFIGNGKGTVGDYLEEEHVFKKDSFAKPMKDAASSIFNWDRKMLEGDTKESRKWRESKDEYWSNVIKRFFTPRMALQQLGTECIRNVFHEDVWSASLISRWRSNDKPDTVITDARFHNELEAISKAGGLTILVKRGKDPEWYSMMNRYNRMKYYEIGTFWKRIERFFTEKKIESLRKKGIIPHISETDWIGHDFDYTIKNDFDGFELLYKAVDLIIKDIKNKRKIQQKKINRYITGGI